MSDPALVWELLYDGVVEFMRDEQIPIVNQFGWSQPMRQPAVPQAVPRRIVWVPGDDSNGNAGKTLGPMNPGRLPLMPIDTLDEIFTIYFVGVDPSSGADERLQYRAARLVFDDWRRAMHYAAYGSAETGGKFAVLSVAWKNDVAKLKARGAALRALVSAQAMIPDEPAHTTGADATAILQSKLDTHADDDNIAPENDGAPTTIPET